MTAQVDVYFTPSCGYCYRARRLLDGLGVKYRAVDVTGDRAKRIWLEEVSGQSTVPQIFIGGVSIGGSDELHELHVQGTLGPLLVG